MAIGANGARRRPQPACIGPCGVHCRVDRYRSRHGVDDSLLPRLPGITARKLFDLQTPVFFLILGVVYWGIIGAVMQVFWRWLAHRYAKVGTV